MADFTIALEGSVAPDFTGTTLSSAFVVLGAGPNAIPLEGPRAKWGNRVENTTGYYAAIDVVGEIVPIVEFGTLIDLIRIVHSPYLRILATGTVLPRLLTAGGANFWTDATEGWIRSNREVARQDFAISHDFGARGDSFTLTLRDIEPNTFD